MLQQMKLNCCLLALLWVFTSCNKHSTADIIYINAYIWDGDSVSTIPAAIAVKDSTIIFVGKEYEVYRDNNTEVIDLGGKLIVPGFIDNHTHFLSGGYQLANINLRLAHTPSAFRSRLKEFTAGLPEGRWIQGGDWDHEIWGGQLPEKEWIDSISGTHPVFVNRYDGHMALANSVTLKLAGITKETRDPPGGEIVRHPRTGEPTGVLKDEAMSLVYSIIPDHSPEVLEESLLRAIGEAHANGVTQVHDMGSHGGWTDLETYRSLHASGRLNLRIHAFVPLSNWEKLDSFVKKNGRGDDLLQWGGVKGFVDGSLGSTTAWFYKPYLDAPATSGFPVTDTMLLRNWIVSADSAGLRLAVHAIGDRANDWLLTTYEQIAKTGGPGDKRFRIEHAQHLSKDAISRFNTLKVIPSMQPYHAIDDGRWAHKRLDEERLKGTYAFKSLLQSGARLTFGSDWSVAPLTPLEGIYAAVTRRTTDNKNPMGWVPEQKITAEEALRCYTINNAYAGFMENKVGALKAGYLADFIVLSENILTIAPEKIIDVKVLRTIVNGMEVYKKDVK